MHRLSRFYGRASLDHFVIIMVSYVLCTPYQVMLHFLSCHYKLWIISRCMALMMAMASATTGSIMNLHQFSKTTRKMLATQFSSACNLRMWIT